ncbi:hypothetical protein [Ktedonospora formicarum]|uniref:Aminoglycoside phosphotransferase domain-containing protein n=1 Tax=Ktedonospora formicarum TaxID=2778364 RepID=A0A8J3I2H4_9CHLR|nr:hypothetical protein [Ktedonospora formicarum]GHO46396.1 hypothetical protein KSX_45590 [Ktedonospora formicarum]
MSSVISRLEEATPEWLTQTLRENGYLPHGSVVTIEQIPTDAFNSLTAHLRPCYSEDADGAAPRLLILKLQQKQNGRHEAGFYHLVTTQHQNMNMLVHCYAQDYNTQSGNSYLLLEDLSLTHVEPTTRQQLLAGHGLPRADHMDGIADALAGFHAHWWEHAELGQNHITAVRPWYSDKEAYEQHIERCHREWDSFKRTTGDEISSQIRSTYEYVLKRLPSLWKQYLEERIVPRKQITLTQGDCYLTQFLCPREVAGEAQEPKGPSYIYDMEAVSANIPAYDIAYLLATFWTPEQRKESRREEQFLHRYLQRLYKFGVDFYTWPQLWRDYQMMVTFMLFDPIWDQTNGSSRSYWYPKLHCLVRNFWDMGCGLVLRKMAEKA